MFSKEYHKSLFLNIIIVQNARRQEIVPRCQKESQERTLKSKQRFCTAHTTIFHFAPLFCPTYVESIVCILNSLSPEFQGGNSNLNFLNSPPTRICLTCISIVGSVIMHWRGERKWEMLFSHTARGLGIGHVTCGGQCVSLHPPIMPCFFTLPSIDFKVCVGYYPILCMFHLSLHSRSAWHGYQWSVRKGVFGIGISTQINKTGL